MRLLNNEKVANKITLSKIDLPQIKSYHIERSTLEDLSVIIHYYDKVRTEIEMRTIKQNLHWKNPYGYFELMPTVTERKILVSIIIKRPHAHRYDVALSSCVGSEFYTVKTYEELNKKINDFVLKI